MRLKNGIGLAALLAFGCKSTDPSAEGDVKDHSSRDLQSGDEKKLHPMDKGFVRQEIAQNIKDSDIPDPDRKAWDTAASIPLSHCDMLLYGKHNDIDTYFDLRMDLGRRLLKGEADGVVDEILTYAGRSKVDLSGFKVIGNINFSPEAIQECQDYLVAIFVGRWGCEQHSVTDYVTYLWKAQLAAKASNRPLDPAVKKMVDGLPFSDVGNFPFLKYEQTVEHVSKPDPEVVKNLAALAGLDDKDPRFMLTINYRTFKAYDGLLRNTDRKGAEKLDKLAHAAGKFLKKNVPQWQSYGEQFRGDWTFFCTVNDL